VAGSTPGARFAVYKFGPPRQIAVYLAQFLRDLSRSARYDFTTCRGCGLLLVQHVEERFQIEENYMRRGKLLLLSLGALALAGCKNQNKEPTAHSEEPYTPSYASLDALEAAPVAEPSTDVTPPNEPMADASAPVPAEQPDEPLSPASGQVYTVQKGDTLCKLARHFYNDQARWRDIWEANKNRLTDPNKLQVGMKLIIP
jgi:nucleoid-associated protein YgaU